MNTLNLKTKVTGEWEICNNLLENLQMLLYNAQQTKDILTW